MNYKYFHYKRYYIECYCLAIPNQKLIDKEYITAYVIKNMSTVPYYNNIRYGFRSAYCTPITDPKIINELDKLLIFQ